MMARQRHRRLVIDGREHDGILARHGVRQIATRHRPSLALPTSPSSCELLLTLAWTKEVMTKLGLTLNEEKTSLRDARQERFTFLGYSVGPHYPYNSRVRMHMGASPSKQSVQRLKAKVRELLVPSNTEPWPEVRDDLNRSLRGWSNYFNLGSPVAAFRSVDHYVRERVRGFLARRHKVAGRGNRRFTFDEIHRNRGVLCLERLPRPAPLWALR
jgi:RNA-directed DNA polymerase